ncbi:MULTISPECIES: alpha/beta hydrolase [unclassified Enterococcus]|uniref:alpha/beta hydrolase n=1 Tax=unclassified Enterococcus TaxID=2608891 RepID=UPI0013EC2582|nr:MULTISPECIES: alpha/beta hydrolase [unclassified Enterococcus]
MKIFKRILIGLVLILGIIGGAGYYYIQQNIYEPSSQAQQAFRQGKEKEDYLLFEAKNQEKDSRPLVIFYPGALVEPESYSIWAEGLAKNGYSVAIAKMPLDLAVLGGKKADKIKEDFPEKDYVIGGHSLGGVMSSRYTHQADPHLKGVFFLASYPDKKGTLKESKLPVLTVTASEDHVLDQEAYEDAKQYLPEQTEYVSINGGNHGGFGSYGEQKGDGKARITNADQQTAIVNTMENWLKKIK